MMIRGHAPLPRWVLVALAALLAGVLVLSSPVGMAKASSISPRELVPLLTRTGVGPDWTILDVTYAPGLFFEVTGIPVPSEMVERATLAFILSETVHDGELPIEVAAAFLLLPDGEIVGPYEARVTAEDPHHRVSRLLFPQPDDWPAAIEDEAGVARLRLIVPDRDGTYSIANTFEWSVPIEVGDTTTAEDT